MTQQNFHQVVIGRAEELSLSDFSIAHLPAKVDTGAYRSAIHADHIQLDESGALHFRLLGEHPACAHLATEVSVRKYRKVSIANSFGHTETRYEVPLRIKIGPRVCTAYFTLANRAKKNYPILLGRQLLNGRFIVDTNSSGLDRHQLAAKYQIKLAPDEEEKYS